MAFPKFLTYLAILCFEKRRPKQKYCCPPKVKHSPPQICLPLTKFWAVYATGLRWSAQKLSSFMQLRSDSSDGGQHLMLIRV